jgi:acyl carrier protein
MTIETDVRAILSNEFGLKAADIDGDAALFSSGTLDSLSSLRLLMSLESAFGLSISPLDVSLEDVDSVNKITETVTRLQA